ncbi:hypothetical protein CPB97_003635, partial [Podila verticillata]
MLHGEFLWDVRRSLHYASNVTIIKANTDCPNVRYDVLVSNDIHSIYEDLNFILDFKKTIVYFNNKDDLLQAYIHLGTKASQSSPPQLEKITCYFTKLAPETKNLNMS